MDVIKAEVRKLKARKSTKVFIIIYALIYLGMVAVYLIGERTFELSLYNEAQFVSSSLNSMMALMLPLLTIYIASQSFVNDFSTGAIKNMFLAPISKDKLFVGKLVAIISLVGVLLVSQFVLSFMLSIILEGGVTIGILTVLGDYIGAFVILSFVALIGALLALVFNSTGIAVLVAYLGYFGISILNMYLPNTAHVSIPAIISNYDQLIGNNPLVLLLSTASYTIILFIAGLLLFEKKEDGLCQSD